MGRAPPQRSDVEGLREQLCDALAELHPLVVADVLRAFLEVSARPCEQMLWSLEFAFDEDDSRVARLEARFVDRPVVSPSDDELYGYDVLLLLPRVIPARPSEGALRTEGGEPARAHEDRTPRSLVARFLRALADLGAYDVIARLEARAVEVQLFGSPDPPPFEDAPL